MERNINALYPRPKGRGSTAIFDSTFSTIANNIKRSVHGQAGHFKHGLN